MGLPRRGALAHRCSRRCSDRCFTRWGVAPQDGWVRLATRFTHKQAELGPSGRLHYDARSRRCKRNRTGAGPRSPVAASTEPRGKQFERRDGGGVANA